MLMPMWKPPREKPEALIWAWRQGKNSAFSVGAGACWTGVTGLLPSLFEHLLRNKQGKGDLRSGWARVRERC